MTLEEIRKANPGKRIVAFASKDNGLQIMAGSLQVDWPSDWPPSVTGQFLEDSGVEVLRVMP